MQPLRRHIIGVLFIILAPIASAAEILPLKESAQLTLSINGGTLVAEIAATPATRRLGLSHRLHLPPEMGMLLIFDKPKKFCLWMRDVYFPLTAIFIDSAARIIAITHMSPHTETLHCSPSPAVYALEISPQWQKKYNLVIGDTVLGLSAADF